jgi:hypothetical protein
MAGMELHMMTGEEIKVRSMSARKLDVKEDPTVDKNYLRQRLPHVYGKVLELPHQSKVEEWVDLGTPPPPGQRLL